jgi:hypothetical protein
MYLGVIHVHAAHGADEQVLAHGHGGFGGAVKRGDKVINSLALPQAAQELGGVFQKTGERNPNFRVSKESIRLAEQCNGGDGALLQSGFQAGAGVGVADAGEVAQRQCLGLLVSRQYQRPKRADASLVKISTLHMSTSE